MYNLSYELTIPSYPVKHIYTHFLKNQDKAFIEKIKQSIGKSENNPNLAAFIELNFLELLNNIAERAYTAALNNTQPIPLEQIDKYHNETPTA